MALLFHSRLAHSSHARLAALCCGMASACVASIATPAWAQPQRLALTEPKAPLPRSSGGKAASSKMSSSVIAEAKAESAGDLQFTCTFVEDREFCIAPDEYCRNDGDPFANPNTVYLNTTFVNDFLGYDVDYCLHVYWYTPDGQLFFDWEPSECDTLRDGYWACWWFNITGLPHCPGEWRVKLDMREGTGSWQVVVNKFFTVEFSDGCTSDAQCDDGNPCTDNWCDCTCQTSNNAAACNDGLYCNGSDTCGGGTCSIHAGDPCTSGSECADSCDEGSDSCFDPAGMPCSDDGNECTDDTCDGSGSCVHPNNTAPCDDGQFCNGADTCENGTCSIHAGNPCTSGPECADLCNEGADHCFDPSGTQCTDDENPCTDDVCDGAGSCIHPNNTAPCDDGLFCNGSDTCTGGACASHAGDPCEGRTECADYCNEATDECLDPPGVSCTDDGNQCTGDQCDGGGACIHPSVVDGTACDDGDPTTEPDECHNGECVGVPNTFAIGGAVYTDLSNPLLSGEEGVRICAEGTTFTDCAMTSAGQGLWRIDTVPLGVYSINVKMPDSCFEQIIDGVPNTHPPIDILVGGEHVLRNESLQFRAFEPAIGDFDCSRTIDLLDLAVLANCLSGPNNPTIPPVCSERAFHFCDSNDDADVDLHDAALYLRGFGAE